MNILAVDTTHGVCSVACVKNNEIVHDVTDYTANKQAERLVSMIEDALAAAGIVYGDLDALAVNVGPGSFTGVRIGMAAVKGINIVKKTPLIGITSLEAVAYPCRDKNKDVLVVLDAKRGQVFCQLFSSDMESITDSLLLSYDEVIEKFQKTSFFLTGNGSNLVSDSLSQKDIDIETCHIDGVSEARNIALLALQKHESGVEARECLPVYVRKPDAKVSSQQ